MVPDTSTQGAATYLAISKLDQNESSLLAASQTSSEIERVTSGNNQ
jgi:hypothetical protein